MKDANSMDRKSLFSFGQQSFDNWRNFVLLEEIPPTEASFLNWLIALWVQIFVLSIVLIVGIFKLYQQSKKIHNDVINSSQKRSSRNDHVQSPESIYIAGLHDLVRSYYQCSVLEFREVKHIIM